MLSINTIQSVKELDIFSVASKYVDLKRAGSIYKGCCPFHDEKTPSFTVNPNKNNYRCYGCDVGGDAISFIMRHEHLDFVPAIEKLAKDHGINIQYEQQTEEQLQKEAEKKTLFEATAFAQRYFQQNLNANAEAIRYLNGRDISHAEIENWNIGFSGESNFISKHATETGQTELYDKASLITKRHGVYYDFFRNRITIPFYDAQNRILSFSGRTTGDDEPKYLNGRETDIFSKSKTLFGIHRYKRPFRECYYTVLVEGQIDVLSLHRIGCTNSLASGGTALTKDQTKIIKKLGGTIIIWYDLDKKNQGLKACIKNIDICLQEGLNVKVYCSWVGKDADDFARDWFRNHPHVKIAEQLEDAAMDGIEFKALYLMNGVETPAEISEAKNGIAATIHNIKNDTLKGEYVKLICKTFKIPEKEFKGILKSIEEAEKKKADEKKNRDAKVIAEDYPDWFKIEEKVHFNKFQFAEYIHNEETGYYFPDSAWYPTQQTNFVLQPLYMIKSYQNPRRMCEVFGFNRLNDRMISEVIDFDEKQLLKREQFESRLAQQSPFITFEGYSNTHHKRLVNKLLFMFKDCFELNTLGYQPEQFWAFSDICFEFPTAENPEGKKREYNEFGVVEIGNINFLSEAKNKRVAQLRSDNNNPYENDLYFVFKESRLPFAQWAGLVSKVYTDEKGWLAVAFVVSTVFRDIILNYTKLPHLHCYGEKGSGKSIFAESIMRVFFAGKNSEGEMYKPYNLAGGGTPYSFHNRLERFRACVQVLNEYDDSNILPEFFDAIKASFDGEGRERGMGIKGKTETMKRNAMLILVGQKVGNRDDNSVLTRSVTVEFLKPKEGYTEEERELQSKLDGIEKDGLSSIIIEILSHRIHFKKRFADLFLQSQTTLQKKVSAVFQKTEARIIKSLTALQLSYTIMGEVMGLPLSAELIQSFVFNKAIEMHQHLQQTDGLSEFWKVIEFLLDRNEIEEEWDFKIRAATHVKLRKTVDGRNVDETLNFGGEKKLLYIRLSQLHQFYCLHLNRMSKEKPLSEKTIATYMSSQAYWIGLCPGTGFKSSQKNKSKDSTSCYVLDYEKIGINLETSSFTDDRFEETIEGTIHKLPESGEGSHQPSGDTLKFVVKSIQTIKAEPVDKKKEIYTTCFAKMDKDTTLEVGDNIKVKGMVSINARGFRNMDVMEITLSQKSLF